MKTLVVIAGPPAVGKMTVGEVLSSKTGMPLLHNHVSIELLLPFFDFDTSAFHETNRTIKDTLISAVANSDHPGLIFTIAWAFDLTEDTAYVSGVITRWLTATQGRVLIVELCADETVKKMRNQHPHRLAVKPSKRDVDASEARRLASEAAHQFNSGGELPLPYRHVLIDNSACTPEQVAKQILASM